jgi:Rhs element Vgr protein
LQIFNSQFLIFNSLKLMFDLPEISSPTTLNGRDTSLVTFKIISNGDDVTTRIGVTGITIQKAINRVGYALLNIADGDIPSQTMPVSDADWFVIGKEIEIKLGYHLIEVTVFKGIVTRHSVRVLQSKHPELMVEIKDPSVKTTTIRRSTHFYNQSDADILSQLLSGYGVDSDVDSTDLNHAFLVQNHCTDWDFMLSRADSQGLLVWTDNGKFYAKKPNFGAQPRLTLSYASGQILEFEADIKAENSYANVTAHHWDSAEQTLVDDQAAEPSGTEQGNMEASSIASVLHDGPNNLYRPSDAESIELQTWADTALQKSRLAKIRGRVSVIGTPDIKPMDWIRFDGFGERFNGKAFVSAVQHEILRGVWTTHIEFGLSPKFYMQQTPDIADLPAAGLVPHINGLHIAKVTKLEGDSQGRIQVVVPYLGQVGGGTSDGIWARLCHVTAGDARGMVFYPELDDEVIVGFLNDDPRNAVILGALHSQNAASPVEAADANPEKGVYCREGMKLVFNDEEKSVTIETESGNKISVSDNDQKISIEDQRGAKIEFTAQGITIDAGSGNVTVKGTVINLN